MAETTEASKAEAETKGNSEKSILGNVKRECGVKIPRMGQRRFSEMPSISVVVTVSDEEESRLHHGETW